MTNPKPTPLSPAAQAVFSAWQEASDGHYSDSEWIPNVSGQLAAALRALVFELITRTRGGAIILNGDSVLSIATELETPNA
jgi:hypothetical protein